MPGPPPPSPCGRLHSLGDGFSLCITSIHSILPAILICLGVPSPPPLLSVTKFCGRTNPSRARARSLIVQLSLIRLCGLSHFRPAAPPGRGARDRHFSYSEIRIERFDFGTKTRRANFSLSPLPLSRGRAQE